MTTAQRIALAVAFERLQARISAQPVTLPHPVITARRAHHVVNRTSRRGPYRRRTANIAE